MSDRDDFEAAFVETLNAGATAWYLKEHQVREDFYLFEDATLTGFINAAWWAWRAGRDLLAAQTQQAADALSGVPHVVH